MVKSKKTRLPATEAAQVATRSAAKTKKAATQHKCSVCKIPFEDPVIRDYHEKVAHTEDNLKPETRIVTLTPLPRTRAGSRMPIVRFKPVHVKSEEEVQSIENVSIGPSGEDPPINKPAPKQATDVRFSVCNYCGYRCKRKSDIRRHIIRVHLANPKPKPHSVDLLFCAVCGQSFEQKISLRRHVVRAHFMQPGLKSGQEMARGYCCDVCGESFLAAKKMLAHRDVLHIEVPTMTWKTLCSCLRKVNRCPQCDRYFARGKFSDEHKCVKVEPQVVDSIERAVNAKPHFRCDQCSLCFVWKLALRLHREIAHPDAEPISWETVLATDIAHYCPSCYLVLDDDVPIEDHQCVSSDGDSRPRMHTCDICGSSYVRKSDYQRHRRTKHSDRFPDAGESDSSSAKRKTCITCPYCDETSGTRNTVLAHIKEVHDIDTDSPFVCVPCNKVFKRKATMDTHNQVYHPKEENAEETSRILKDAEILLNGEAAFHCRICNRNMHNAMRFVAHYRLHFVERKFTCDLCGKQTRTQHQLNTHIKIIHLNIRKYECDLCGKGFHAKQSCEEHRRIHTGERPFSCEICGKTFIAMNALFTHKKFHNDFYAHPCSMCDKKFKVRRSLINHIRTHTGERPFKCELCPKTFNNSSRFSYHKKVTHSDARPFSCAQCGSCFKANKFLMRHMKLHKVRSHIQFRRRNNPAYFAASGSNGTAKGGQKRLTVEADGENGIEYKDEVGAVMCSLQETFGAESNARMSHNSEHDTVVDVEESKEFFGDFKAAEGRIDFGSAEGGGDVGANSKFIRRL